MVRIQQKEQEFAEWKQALWDDWWEGSGHCKGCPIRCENHGSPPDYGAFNPDADVMIVGREPGASKRFLVEEAKGKPRKYRTVPKEKAQKPPRDRSHYPYDHNILVEWRFYWDGPAKLFGLGNGDSQNICREIVNQNPRETYYTNALKCTRLPSESEHLEYENIPNPGKLNNEARDQCQNHLREEIDLVNPEVVVTFSEEAFTHTMDALGRDYKNTNLKSWINETDDPELFARYGSNPTVVPSYHWSGQFFVTNMRNAVAISDSADANECWAVLAKTVNSVLTE